MEMNYRITIRKIATGEHKSITRSLTDEAYEQWRDRMNKAENGYVITIIEIDSIQFNLNSIAESIIPYFFKLE